MPRLPNPSFLVVLLLAAAATGCSTPFGPKAAPVAEPPALLSTLPDAPEAAQPVQTLEPAAKAATPAVKATAPAAKAAAAPRASRTAQTGRGTERKDGSSTTGSAQAGPSVTTYTYSDAPVAVRQGPARETLAERPAVVPAGFNPYRIGMPAGAYRCELGRSVHVREVSADMRTTVLRWGTRDYTLRAVQARSGALRYEDESSGLAWIVIPGTSMLLDTREGQRLANACRA